MQRALRGIGVSARSLFAILRLGILLGINISLSSCSEPAAQASDQSEGVLQLEITVNRQALSESRVQIDATLTNGLAHSISFSAWNTPFSSQITGRVFKVEKRIDVPKFGGQNVGGDYTLVPYTGIMLKRGAPSTQDYLTLEPGQQISNSLDITAAYGFTERSQLRVTYDRPINIGNNNFRSLTSNTINFYY
ncbi:MAG: hypothetical protein ACI9U1_000276 [Porticoccaceae bacterium]